MNLYLKICTDTQLSERKWRRDKRNVITRLININLNLKIFIII